MRVLLCNTAPLLRKYESVQLLHNIATFINFLQLSVPYEAIVWKLVNIVGDLEPNAVWQVRHSASVQVRGAKFFYALI